MLVRTPETLSKMVLLNGETDLVTSRGHFLTN